MNCELLNKLISFQIGDANRYTLIWLVLTISLIALLVSIFLKKQRKTGIIILSLSIISFIFINTSESYFLNKCAIIN